MVEHKHKEFIIAWADGKIIQREVIDYEAEEGQHGNTYWLDDLHPKWDEDSKYRVKPEVVKPEWPETTMTETELEAVYYYDAPGYNHTVIANAAIAHALETGLVVLPNISISSSVQSTNYKKDAEEWGGALNEAAWTFIEDNPEKSALLFNTCKTSLRAAILKYLECVEKEVV